jgi:phosphate/phosphite/phosphonate ABC transporter binding protein
MPRNRVQPFGAGHRSDRHLLRFLLLEVLPGKDILMTIRITLLIAGVLVAAGPAAADEKAAARTDKECAECCQSPALKIGAVAYSPNSVTIFRAIRHYFAKNKMPVEFILYSTYDGLNAALANKQVDVAWNSPLGHAKFHLKAGASQTLVMRDADVDYTVKLIVRKDSGISALSSLAGKSMIFGSCDSADSTVLPVYFLKNEGVQIDKLKIVSLHDEVDEIGCPCHSQHHVLAALVQGRGQAGILSSELWKRLQTEKPAQAALLREVWTSPPFSHCVFTARKDFCKETGALFTKLMLAMDGKNTLTAEILKLEHCTRWVPAGKEAQEGYAQLLTALRELHTVPAVLRR